MRERIWRKKEQNKRRGEERRKPEGNKFLCETVSGSGTRLSLINDGGFHPREATLVPLSKVEGS
jgi:hypothetical protein